MHLEFQATNDKNMLLRMGEYHALLVRRYDLEVKHFVLYFGDAKPTMETRLTDDSIFKGFELKNLKDFKHSMFESFAKPTHLS